MDSREEMDRRKLLLKHNRKVFVFVVLDFTTSIY